LRVCYFGTYRGDYSRNQIMIEGLRRNNVEVVECHVPLWHGIEDRVEVASGGWLRPSFVARVLRTYWELLRRYLGTGDYDVMVLGYPGQVDVYLARLLTWLRRRPLVLDVFMSIYLIASERGLTRKSRITGRAIRAIERLACTLPDLLILDTADYVEWFQQTYGLKETRFALVPTGADDRVFHPVEGEAELRRGTFDVLYYGTFIPNHGVKHIVDAARILQDDPSIHFGLVGEGPTKAEAVDLVEGYELRNVTFEGWMEKKDIPRRVANADVCLGAFGTTPQSLMTVQNKIYEALAMAKPVITGESRAVTRSFRHGTHLYLCERANPQSLANAVRMLRADPHLRRQLAENGHRLYFTQFDLTNNGLLYISLLRQLLSSRC